MPWEEKDKYQRTLWPQTSEILDALPPVIDIDAPAVGPTASRSIMVRVAKKAGLPLFVRLDEPTIDYLSGAIKEQIEKGDIHRKRTDSQEGVKVDAPEGFSYSYKRNKLVKTQIIYSPKTRKRKTKTTFHDAAASSSAFECDNHIADGDDDAPGDPDPDDDADESELEEVIA